MNAPASEAWELLMRNAFGTSSEGVSLRRGLRVPGEDSIDRRCDERDEGFGAGVDECRDLQNSGRHIVHTGGSHASYLQLPVKTG